MNAADLKDAEVECGRLCVDFANLIDARDYARFVDLFTHDGELVQPTQSFKGHAQIWNFLKARPDDVATRHFCTNVRVTVGSMDDASGVCYFLLFRGVAGNPQTPAPIVAECHDLYRRTPGGWKIQRRQVKTVF